jgi:hypothetical protein
MLLPLIITMCGTFIDLWVGEELGWERLVWRLWGRSMIDTRYWIGRSNPCIANDSLGKGSFAEVRKAVDVETGDLRAIKVGRTKTALT